LPIEYVEQVLLVLGGGEVFNPLGAFRHFRRLLPAKAYESVSLFVAQPIDRDAAHIAAIAIEFAALDGNALFSAAGEAEDLLDRRPEDQAQNRPVDVVARSLGGCSQDELFAPHHVVPTRDAFIAISIADP